MEHIKFNFAAFDIKYTSEIEGLRFAPVNHLVDNYTRFKIHTRLKHTLNFRIGISLINSCYPYEAD